MQEAREAIPVIDFVQRRLLDACHDTSLRRIRVSAEDMEEADGPITVVEPWHAGLLTCLGPCEDLCSGLGFLGMFLSELLPAVRVNVTWQMFRKLMEMDGH